MAPIKKISRHGTRARYQDGCRCDKCRLAESNYQKIRRHGVDEKDAVPTEVGSVEATLLEEFPEVPEDRQTLFETARVLARLLDNRAAVSQHVGGSKQMAETLALLRKGAGKKSRLTAVREMSKPMTG